MLINTRGYYAKALGYAWAATINDCDVSGEGTGMLTRAFHVELLTKPRVCEASLSELFSSPPHTHTFSPSQSHFLLAAFSLMLFCPRRLIWIQLIVVTEEPFCSLVFGRFLSRRFFTKC